MHVAGQTHPGGPSCERMGDEKRDHSRGAQDGGAHAPPHGAASLVVVQLHRDGRDSETCSKNECV
jgi:hypothetical protein